uniref:Uncharacterized protein n=1 Tax=Aegilops tauschii TaxID=37682 RepID=M8BBU7_AEGTA
MVKGRVLGACLLLLAAALADGEGEEGKRGVPLLDAGRLEKFMDELPDMPVLRGYGVAEGGNLVAGELAVGMYDTMWFMRLIILNSEFPGKHPTSNNPAH